MAKNYKKTNYGITKDRESIIYHNADGNSIKITFDTILATDPTFTKESFDEIMNVYVKSERAERSYLEKLRYHKAFYSLDEDNGIEKDILFVSQSPDELYEKKLSQSELYAAINQLSETQAKRIYAHYFQNMSYSEIAKTEGVHESSIRESISVALKRMEKFLKKI